MNNAVLQKIERWFSQVGTCSVHVLVEISRDHSPTLLAAPMEPMDDEQKLRFAWPVARCLHSAVYGPVDRPFKSLVFEKPHNRHEA